MGILVDDLTAGVEGWRAATGLDDWYVVTYDAEEIDGLSYHGSPGSFAMRLALAGQAPQIEFIEPLRGPSIYGDWIAERGYGMHHLGFHVDDIMAAVAAMAADGFEPIQSGFGYGADGDGGFAYYEVPSLSPLIVEIIEVPTQRRPSEPLESRTAN
ncbi:VOC family protein [Streptomyces sp. NPDC060209]|uniref:VOC family protein n=1 Tax=Streptomyces sp. NPDC060209 TaxID=3347073 RepID=UPI00364F59D5